MAVQQLRGADAVFAYEFAEPREQDFQAARFGGLGGELSLLHGLWTC